MSDYWQTLCQKLNRAECFHSRMMDWHTFNDDKFMKELTILLLLTPATAVDDLLIHLLSII